VNTPGVFKVTQGRTATFPRTTPQTSGAVADVYAGTESITANVWPAGTQALVLTQSGAPNAWLNPATTTWQITFVDSQTSTLTPGVYDLEVTSQPSGTSGETGVLFRGQMLVDAAAGSTASTDLITAYYAAKGLAVGDFTNEQWDFLPDAISAASKAVVKWCNREFVFQTYIEDLQPAVDGVVRLKGIPVAQVTRTQSIPQMALTIQNGTAQIAYVVYSFTGDVASGQVITGLNFTSVINGVSVTQNVAYSTNETISAVATAISALGNGWSCTLNTSYSAWPATELLDGWVSQDAVTNGVILNVYSQGVSQSRFDPDDGQNTGLLWVGRQNSPFGPQWGPDYAAWEDGVPLMGLVRVTYTGGFLTIPLPVQLAVLETTKATLERLKLEAYIESETGGDYTYQVALEAMKHLPQWVLTNLAGWRVHNA
jgi:hypothetical protein